MRCTNYRHNRTWLRKIQKILKINVSADQPQWDQYVIIAVMALNTTYHTSLKCSPTEVFHGRTPHSTLDLKFANPIRATGQPMDLSRMLDEINEKYTKNVQKTCITKTKRTMTSKPVPSPSKSTILYSC